MSASLPTLPWTVWLFCTVRLPFAKIALEKPFPRTGFKVTTACMTRLRRWLTPANCTGVAVDVITALNGTRAAFAYSVEQVIGFPATSVQLIVRVTEGLSGTLIGRFDRGVTVPVQGSWLWSVGF